MATAASCALDDADIRHVIPKRRNRKWFVCLMLDLPEPAVASHTGPAVGIDMGLHSLVALSDGQMVDNPCWLRHSLARLRVAQRRMARRRKGGRGWQEAAAQVAHLHERIANQRRDFWHKLTQLK